MLPRGPCLGFEGVTMSVTWGLCVHHNGAWTLWDYWVSLLAGTSKVRRTMAQYLNKMVRNLQEQFTKP